MCLSHIAVASVVFLVIYDLDIIVNSPNMFEEITFLSSGGGFCAGSQNITNVMNCMFIVSVDVLTHLQSWTDPKGFLA